MSRVLIVDDNVGVIELISHFFKEKGYLTDSVHFCEAEQRFLQKYSFYSHIFVNVHPVFYKQILKLHFQILIHRPDIRIFIFTDPFCARSLYVEALRRTCVVIDNLTQVFNILEEQLV